MDSITLRHELGEEQWIEIDSAIAEDEFHLPDARHEAAELLEGSTDAEVALRVDGVDLVFAFASVADRWVAIGSVGDVTITVEARGMNAADLRLRALADPARLVGAETPEYRPGKPDRDVLDRQRVAELADATRSRTSARRWPALPEPGSPFW